MDLTDISTFILISTPQLACSELKWPAGWAWSSGACMQRNLVYVGTAGMAPRAGEFSYLHQYSMRWGICFNWLHLPLKLSGHQHKKWHIFILRGHCIALRCCHDRLEGPWKIRERKEKQNLPFNLFCKFDCCTAYAVSNYSPQTVNVQMLALS